jgi:hypothetical protein
MMRRGREEMKGRQRRRRKHLPDDGEKSRKKVRGIRERRHKHLLDELNEKI